MTAPGSIQPSAASLLRSAQDRHSQSIAVRSFHERALAIKTAEVAKLRLDLAGADDEVRAAQEALDRLRLTAEART